MTQVTIHEAKTNLSKLIRKALEGEEVVIAKGKQPLVRLAVLEPEEKARRFGWAKGSAEWKNLVRVCEDPALDKEIENDFYSES